MADTIATSFGVLNYSGMLFNKGNVRTPFSSAIGGRTKTTDHVEFVTGQEYTGGGTDAWASNEAMVDWIARQGQKIYAAWREAGALDA